MRATRAVTLRYARVLFELKDGKCLEVISALSSIKDEKVKQFVGDPTILAKEKAELIAHAFNTNKKCENLLRVIFEHKRFRIFPDLYQTAWAMRLRDSGKEQVVVRSAQVLNKDETDMIVKIVREIRKSEPILKVVHDPKLLAGITIDFEDSVVDLSVSGALEKVASFMYGG